MTDAQLAALRDDINERAQAIPGGPWKMYERGVFTGLMNGLDPYSPNCTRDPVLAARFYGALREEIANATKEQR